MYVRKGEVKLFISPTDWLVYKRAGWTRVLEPSKEKIKRMNDRAKAKRLAQMKGELDNDEQ